MDTEGEPITAEYAAVPPAAAPFDESFKENQAENQWYNQRSACLRRLYSVFYWLIGLGIAILLSHAFPTYAECLKHACAVPLTVLDFVILMATVALWPIVVVALVVGKAMSMFL
jgi:hypothetical protein